MVKRTSGTDTILWIGFLIATGAVIVLDRLVPRALATWGWVLILIALSAGLAALAWPLLHESADVEPDTSQPRAIEPVVEAADPLRIQEEAPSAQPPTGPEAHRDTL